MNELPLRIIDRNRPAGVAPKGWRDEPSIARLCSFVDLTRSDLDALFALIECEYPVKKRRELVLDGYPFGKLGFIKDGFAVRYKLLRNGKRQIVSFLLPGDVIGLPGSFLDRAAHSVIAVTDMTLRVCALDAFVNLCCRGPKFALVLSWLAAQEAAVYAERIISIGRRTPTERLAHFLLEIHSRLSAVGRADDVSCELPFTQEMMSDALGLSVPHLNRTLRQLRADGMVAIDDHRVFFTDMPELAQLAQFQPVNPVRIPMPAFA
jgi:CRP-like cAMP-binding protein